MSQPWMCAGPSPLTLGSTVPKLNRSHIKTPTLSRGGGPSAGLRTLGRRQLLSTVAPLARRALVQAQASGPPSPKARKAPLTFLTLFCLWVLPTYWSHKSILSLEENLLRIPYRVFPRN